jgi:predicted helicase
LKRVAGTNRESVVREAFKDLLKAWGRSRGLDFVAEYKVETKTKERRYVDGALLYTLRVPFGYWEAKDSDDDLDDEIDKKFRAGYPKTNIIFEDSTQAVLFQHGEEVMRCGAEDSASLEKLLKLYFDYERPEIEAFRKAVEQFKTDLPNVLEALRSMISRAHGAEPEFRSAASEFLTHAKEVINPSLVDADVREMLIQHILTGEVFDAVFPGTTFHEDNNVARELHKLEATFFTGNTKFQTLKGLEPYYGAIRRAASQIATHSEKQSFLKAVYENFYKVYNPKAADRLGVVYTPNEIVRFMVEGADWLCEQHFRRNLIDEDVDILDPATGTGTFLCEMIDHFAGQPKKLTEKYLHSIHANEVAILPYYVANLNIEATYAAVTGRYEEFPGLCFVDTLDNVFALRKFRGHMDDMFGAVADDNVKRIRNQNSRRISVIIGNPPYNANQRNENENNKNREYKEIDKRIKQTYVKESRAQKTKAYDMYSRFFRWASDRLDENGILAFITNRSFIDKRTFDGFRAVVATEFSEIRVLDLGGDVKDNPKLNGAAHNVFGIPTGVAISFMVRRGKQKGCRIYYARRPEMDTAEDKLSFLSSTALRDVSFEEVRPDTKHNWINQTSNDFDSLLPLASKETKSTKKRAQEFSVFKLFSLGVVTNRDEWVYNVDPAQLSQRVSWLIDAYNADLTKLSTHRGDSDLASQLDTSIKWTRAVKNDLRHGVPYTFDPRNVTIAMYRPFAKMRIYFDKHLNEMHYRQGSIFPLQAGCRNRAIVYTQAGSQKPFTACAVSALPDLHFVGAAAGAECLPYYRFENGERRDNITDWALDRFRQQYQQDSSRQPVTRAAIFHYVYAVLNDPEYLQKYDRNLRRDFPHIPFYRDFWVWAGFGKSMMDLHIGFENARPAQLKRADVPDERSRRLGLSPKTLLRADLQHGIIELDSETTLTGIPAEAWQYKLGGRSALEWVLDQYKEKKPKDPTIREKFNTYRFADYKEVVVDLLKRVTTVSVETVQIIRAMKKAAR